MKRKLHHTVTADSAVAGGHEYLLTFQAEGGHPIPAVLLLPEADSTPAPAAVLLHGYSSRKEDMAGPVGRALLAHGIGSLAIDLPLHGTRADPLQSQSSRNPLAMMQLWRQALADARLAIQYLAARRETDNARIAIVGYSMGAFLAASVTPDEPLVRAVVLAAGGDLPENTPFTTVGRMIADPLKAVRRFNGRPLLMVHGRRDRTILPEQAQRLFDAAGEPKELRWCDAGHYLPADATGSAAAWLHTQLRQTPGLNAKP